MDEAGRRAAGQLGEYGYEPPRERSVSEMVKAILANLQEIIRSELRLAKAEIREESKTVLNAGLMLGVGAVVGLFGAGFLLAAATAALALVMPWWAGALLVGVVLALAGAITVGMGVARWKRLHPAAEKAIGDLKENVEWLKRQTRS